jgi:8-oxo-dGTP pyrophosphatase MutT (NUDIX family)
LVVRREDLNSLQVMLTTSRSTQRLIVPKGWPMKGRPDYRAAVIEAKQEAGVIGKVHKKAIGSYDYWKRLSDHFILCTVRVFLLEAQEHLPKWKERGERRIIWFSSDEAAHLVDDPGLSTIIRNLPRLIKLRRLSVTRNNDPQTEKEKPKKPRKKASPKRRRSKDRAPNPAAVTNLDSS